MAGTSVVVRQAVYAHLADPVIGFNATMPQIAKMPPFLAEGVEPYVIDFIHDPSMTFFFGEHSLDDLLETTVIKPNPAVMCMFTTSLQSMPGMVRQKNLRFSGSVEVGIDVWITWPQGKPLRNCEVISDLTAETLIGIFNTPDAAHQDWGNTPDWNIVYGQTLSLSPSPIYMGAKHWVKKVMARATFDVHAV